MQIAVNISARQFHDQDLAETVIRILDETGLPPNYLELELTESSIMQNAEFAAGMLNRLKSRGSISQLTTSAPGSRRLPT